MAVWTMIPDKIEEEETQVAMRFGVFGATFITFFLAEMGDKTQLLDFILAARFKKLLPIILGILAATVINHGLAGALGAC